MIKRAMLACLVSLVFTTGAHAIPYVPYFGVHGEATALAVVAGAPAGFDSQSGSPATDALIAGADAVATSDVATAGSVVAVDLLSTNADVSAVDVGSAVSTARFAGAFVNPGQVDLAINFTRMDSASGSGAASTTLFVSLVSDGVSLFRDYVQDSWWQMSYTPVVGTTSLLEILLVSEASAAIVGSGAGNASAFGQVSVVPETSTWLMLSFGLIAVGAYRSAGLRRQRGI